MKMHTIHKSFTSLVVGCLVMFMVGCRPGVPSEYIQPSELEDMLYDWHLAVPHICRVAFESYIGKSVSAGASKCRGFVVKTLGKVLVNGFQPLGVTHVVDQRRIKLGLGIAIFLKYGCMIFDDVE